MGSTTWGGGVKVKALLYIVGTDSNTSEDYLVWQSVIKTAKRFRPFFFCRALRFRFRL